MAVGAVRVTYEGQVYEFDLMKIPTEELREIKRKTGMTVSRFLAGVIEADVDALLCLKWCLLRSDGQHDDLVLNASDPFDDYWQFAQAWNAAEDVSEPDPTKAGSHPATSTPQSSVSSSPTLTSSPPSTASPSPGSAESANGKSGGSVSELSSATSPASTP